LEGNKSLSTGVYTKEGKTSNYTPLLLEFTASREGYHQLSVKLTNETQIPARAFIKVEYEAPVESEKF
jgi:hypothetical protein